MKAAIKTCLFLTLLFIGATLPSWADDGASSTANTKTVYARVVGYSSNGSTAEETKSVNSDYTLYFHVWRNRKVTKDGTDYYLEDETVQSGFGDKVTPTTADVANTALGGNSTWAAYTFPASSKTLDASETVYYYQNGTRTALELSAGDVIQYTSYNIMFAVYDKDGNEKFKSKEIYNITNKLTANEIFFEVTVTNGTATNGSAETAFSVDEMNRKQAEGVKMHAWLCKADGTHVAEFSQVRDQTVVNGSYPDGTVLDVVGHSYNNTLYSLGLKKADMPETFYVVLGYNDADNQFTPLRYYWPKWGTDNWSFSNNDSWSYTYTRTNDNWVSPGYARYGSCETTTESAPTHYFALTKADEDVSYSLYLNTSDIYDGDYNVNSSARQDNNGTVTLDYYSNNNMSVYYDRKYETNSLGMSRNKAITVADDATIYYMANMVEINPANTGHEIQMGTTNSWDPTDTSRPMVKITDNATYAKDFATLKTQGFCNDGDQVYYYHVVKPIDKFNALFMGFRIGTFDKTSEDGWNSKVIRPQIQQGKTGTALSGSIFIPTDKGENNAMEALTPDLADNAYTQFSVYLNLSQSTYIIVPRESYDLTGPAIVFWNLLENSWDYNTDAAKWGNGNYQNMYVAMSYNRKEDCYQWTGRFQNQQCINEDGTVGGESNGFRIRTNQLYTKNYHEEAFWQDDNNWHSEVAGEWHDNTTYADYVNSNASDKTKAIQTQRPLASVPGWTNEDGTHNPNGPDTYYYNHVLLCDETTGEHPKWENVKDAKHKWSAVKQGNNPVQEDQARLNLNWDLPSGYYTIKFYPQGDETGKPYYVIEPASDPATPMPDNDKYKYLRTYSSAFTYAIPDGMRVFIATKSESRDVVLLKDITALGFLPASTGLVIAYNDDISTKGKDYSGEFEFDTDDAKDNYIAIGNVAPRLELTLYKEKTEGEVKTAIEKYKWGGEENNYLVPVTTMNASGMIDSITTAVPTTEYTADGTQVAFRNYMLTVTGKYLKNTDGTYQTDADGNKKWDSSATKFQFRRIKVYHDPKKDHQTPGRAYLHLPAALSGSATIGDYDNHPDAKSGSQPTEAKQCLIVFGDEAATGITEVTRKATVVADNNYYTLEGIQIAKPTRRGIYIHNGKKVIIR